MRQVVIEYRAALLEMCRATRALAQEQDCEIAQINQRYKGILADYDKAHEEMDTIINRFSSRWGNRMEERDSKIAAVNQKYEQLHQDLLKEVNRELDGGDE